MSDDKRYKGPGFDGATYQHDLDYQRLGRQSKAVFEALLDGRWKTLAQLSALTHYPEASISARLRDFRKKKSGRWIVEAQRTGNVRSGVWIYRLAGKEDAA